MAASLAPGASVTIASIVSSVQTITVDVRGASLPSLPLPPGAEIVETRGPPHSPAPAPAPAHHRPWTPRGAPPDSADSYRIVYRIQREHFGSTSLRGGTVLVRIRQRRCHACEQVAQHRLCFVERVAVHQCAREQTSGTEGVFVIRPQHLRIALRGKSIIR